MAAVVERPALLNLQNRNRREFSRDSVCCPLVSPSTSSSTKQSVEALAKLVSARAFGIATPDGRLINGVNTDARLNIASITKVLSFMTIFETIQRTSAGAATTLKRLVKISATAAAVKQGTNAQLRTDDVVSVNDLLYAMMLPSGNDAATALSEFFGARLLAHENRGAVPLASKLGKSKAASLATQRFVDEMNALAHRLGCVNTTMHDPHGMRSQRNNKSTVTEVVCLMTAARQNPVFLRVYGTKKFVCNVRNNSKARRVVWRSTNDMLWGRNECDGYVCEGGKTGWIPNVLGQRVWGSLATIVARHDASGDGGDDSTSAVPQRLLIVVIGCKSRKRRFIDSRLIARWAFGLRDPTPPITAATRERSDEGQLPCGTSVETTEESAES